MRGENSVQRYLALLYGYIEESKRTGDHQAVLDDSAVALWAVSVFVYAVYCTLWILTILTYIFLLIHEP